jgi:hypothetical protein
MAAILHDISVAQVGDRADESRQTDLAQSSVVEDVDSSSSWLARLEGHYAFKEPEEVINFLQEHPYLFELLEEAYDKIKEYYGPDTHAFLEITPDYEGEGLRELFVRIETSLPVKEALSILDRLDEEWWFDASARAQGRMNIDLNFIS